MTTDRSAAHRRFVVLAPRPPRRRALRVRPDVALLVGSYLQALPSAHTAVQAALDGSRIPKTEVCREIGSPKVQLSGGREICDRRRWKGGVLHLYPTRWL